MIVLIGLASFSSRDINDQRWRTVHTMTPNRPSTLESPDSKDLLFMQIIDDQ